MKRAEQETLKALADHLRARAAAGSYWSRSVIEGAILKACGGRARIPDVILVKDGKTFGLEVQANETRAAGATAFAIDDALAQLERWQLLRGQTQ
jgi:hypothetical protein